MLFFPPGELEVSYGRVWRADRQGEWAAFRVEDEVGGGLERQTTV